ncbi:MAG TPA: ACT domain-containing protein [Acidobacteriota bacterium]|nr:ACT domain-containing protein [Acidobacteriota bacterium]HMZ79405.1 ACT domain-containing protein [Acidobacteriota bacterium]HNB70820.1 ACT domain-containing protein [Acidobacteriota bacterium]
MKDEEIIYQITRSVYRKLGQYADRTLVEDMVTDIFRSIRPALGDPSSSAPAPIVSGAPPEVGGSNRAVISIFGQDGAGIIAAVARVLADAECSIVDINQTVLRGKFAMMLIADISTIRGSLTDLQQKLKTEASQLGVKAYVQREDLFHAMHRV